MAQLVDIAVSHPGFATRLPERPGEGFSFVPVGSGVGVGPNWVSIGSPVWQSSDSRAKKCHNSSPGPGLRGLCTTKSNGPLNVGTVADTVHISPPETNNLAAT